MDIEDKIKLAEWMGWKISEEFSFAPILSKVYDKNGRMLFRLAVWMPDKNNYRFLEVLKEVIKKGLKPKVYAALEDQNLREDQIPQNMGFFDTIVFGYECKDKIMQAVMQVIDE